MAFARDHQNIAVAEPGNRGTDCFGTIADFASVRTAGQDFPADRARVFAARIVVGDDHMIGQLHRDGTHLGALDLVAVAAAAEHHDQFARGVRAQRGQNVFKRIWRVGVIDINRRAAGRHGDFFQTPGRALQMFERRHDAVHRFAQPDGHARGHQHVRCLKSTGKRQRNSVCLAGMDDGESLTVGRGFARHQFEAAAILTDGDQAQAAFGRRGDERLGMIGIGIDHRCGPVARQFAEQPELGVQVMAQRGMVIAMVGRQVGESHGGNFRAVQPVLIEPMAGGFERQMIDAVGFDLGQNFLNFNRTWRRVVQRDRAVGCHDADCAHARRTLAERRPNLAQEHRDRGLAVGAGDCRDGGRLGAVEGGCGRGQRLTRIFRREEFHARGVHGCFDFWLAEYGDRAAPHRIADKGSAVALGAGNRGKQKTCFDVAAVAGKAGKLLHRLGTDRHLFTRYHYGSLWRRLSD